MSRLTAFTRKFFDDVAGSESTRVPDDARRDHVPEVKSPSDLRFEAAKDRMKFCFYELDWLVELNKDLCERLGERIIVCKHDEYVSHGVGTGVWLFDMMSRPRERGLLSNAELRAFFGPFLALIEGYNLECRKAQIIHARGPGPESQGANVSFELVYRKTA